MTTKTRLWLLAAGAASVLLALLALTLRSDAPPPSPVTVVSRPVIPIPVAAAPAPARATPAPAVVQVGVRQDYIVQADSVEVARSAVVRVGGVVKGKTPYLSPEHVDPDGTVDDLSDQYCLGAVAYALLTGRPPCEGATPAETVEFIREAVPS